VRPALPTSVSGCVSKPFCCHIDTSALLPELLGPEAMAWLNDYNARVYETLAPLLPEDVAHWLKSKTIIQAI